LEEALEIFGEDFQDVVNSAQITRETSRTKDKQKRRRRRDRDESRIDVSDESSLSEEEESDGAEEPVDAETQEKVIPRGVFV
ncbi:MAG: hypothetical protein AAF411_07170, partial [Myxococcota bacterium]